MTKYRTSRLALLFVLYCCISLAFIFRVESVAAHDGEDHSTPAAGNTIAAVPRGSASVESASDQVELSGRFDKGVLRLYVDDFATNAPIAGLMVEVSSDNESVTATEKAPGFYEASLSWVSGSGHFPLTFLLTGGSVSDLQQATLAIEAPHEKSTDQANVASSGPRTPTGFSYPYALSMGAAIVGLVIGWWARGRRARVSASSAVGVLSLLLILAWHPSPLYAHDGENHGSEDQARAQARATEITGETPHRLPDGRIFMPKASQHLLQLRTLLARQDTAMRQVKLNGRVIADPSASGVVQAAQAGRIDAGENGLPVMGQRVKAGQVLAWLTPVGSSLERGNQQAALAALDSEWQIAEQRRVRLETLVGSLPRKDIEAARIEAESLRHRRAAVAASLDQREPLRATVDGVISASEAVAGQVVKEGDLLFSIVQPDRLWVEALSYEPALLAGDAPSVALVGPVSMQLIRVAQGATLEDQAIPLLFRVQAPVPALAVGQPVTVLVSTRAPLQGIPVPLEAVSRNAQGEWIAWVHETALLFRPVGVRFEALDGQSVMITHGLLPGMRVVASGASILGQIR
jgi:cobalt-zinc-cadmium efflux system membrane fusion protein